MRTVLYDTRPKPPRLLCFRAVAIIALVTISLHFLSLTERLEQVKFKNGSKANFLLFSAFASVRVFRLTL